MKPVEELTENEMVTYEMDVAIPVQLRWDQFIEHDAHV